MALSSPKEVDTNEAIEQEPLPGSDSYLTPFQDRYQYTEVSDSLYRPYGPHLTHVGANYNSLELTTTDLVSGPVALWVADSAKTL